jgi:hypothetical protein
VAAAPVPAATVVWSVAPVPSYVLVVTMFVRTSWMPPPMQAGGLVVGVVPVSVQFAIVLVGPGVPFRQLALDGPEKDVDVRGIGSRERGQVAHRARVALTAAAGHRPDLGVVREGNLQVTEELLDRAKRLSASEAIGKGGDDRLADAGRFPCVWCGHAPQSADNSFGLRVAAKRRAPAHGGPYSEVRCSVR